MTAARNSLLLKLRVYPDSTLFILLFCGMALLEKYSDCCGGGENNNKKDNMTAKHMMFMLRDHDSGICMHGGGFETMASMVSELYPESSNHVHWMMDTPNPCRNEYTIQPVVINS